ncbi:MAG: hypothetical protein ABEH80_10020 [Halobaculum sp.]|jgi:hypothetical protein
MPDPARLRDSTQIVLPCAALDGVREELEAEFTVTVYSADDSPEVCRIIASPVEIKAVADFLTRRGISVQ